VIAVPFLQDIEPRDEPRTPVWAAFATVASQVERLVAVNVVWALQLAPGLLALAFPGMPAGLRIAMLLYSAVAVAPATAVLYGVAAHACRHQHVDPGLVVQLARELTLPGLKILGPLAGSFGILLWTMVAASSVGLDPLNAPLTLAVLLWSLCAIMWGPTIAGGHFHGIRGVVRASAHLVWSHPGQMLWTWVMSVVAAVIGAVSIGGLVLIVPIFIAILHTHRYQAHTAELPHEVKTP
jgi:hypothetical protein